MKLRPLILLTLAAAMVAGPGSARTVEPPPVGQSMAGPRTGLICIWAIYASMIEVGRTCGVTRNVPFEAELERSVSQMEDYARRQSPNGAAFMASYRPRLVDRDAGLCEPDSVRMYSDMSRISPETVRVETDRLLSRRPSVEWGTCL